MASRFQREVSFADEVDLSSKHQRFVRRAESWQAGDTEELRLPNPRNYAELAKHQKLARDADTIARMLKVGVRQSASNHLESNDRNDSSPSMKGAKQPDTMFSPIVSSVEWISGLLNIGGRNLSLSSLNLSK